VARSQRVTPSSSLGHTRRIFFALTIAGLSAQIQLPNNSSVILPVAAIRRQQQAASKEVIATANEAGKIRTKNENVGMTC